MKKLMGLLSLFMIFALPAASFGAAIPKNEDQVPRITVGDLKALQEAGEELFIVDMRVGITYTGSTKAIKGSTRIPLKQLDNRIGEVPMGAKIITYCT